MDIKVLIQAFDRPWLIEPSAAMVYAEILHNFLSSSTIQHVAGNLNPDAPFTVNQFGKPDASGPVMVIPINGPMMKNDYCGSPGTATMADMINKANNDSSIKSIVLSISSPGGSVDGTEHLANAVASSKKPVVAHGDMMASAAYWVASQAKEIFLNGKTSMAGSIGTMAVIRDMRQFQQSRGVNEVVLFASRSTDKNRAALQAMDGNPDAYIREFLDPINSVFESSVKTGRQGKVDYAKEDVGTGKVYMGKAALNSGLADKIGSFESAVKRSIQLANSNLNTNMSASNEQPIVAFQNTMQAAQVSEFPITNDGFALSEENLNNIENTLIANASRISELEGQATQLTQNLQNATEASALAAQQLSEAQAMIQQQAARIAELEALPPAAIGQTSTDKPDEVPGAAVKKLDAITQEANRLREMQGKPPIK